MIKLSHILSEELLELVKQTFRVSESFPGDQAAYLGLCIRYIPLCRYQAADDSVRVFAKLKRAHIFYRVAAISPFA